jgi:hypothetical protein
VGELRELGEGRAVRHAGERRLDLARDAADLGRGAHLRIEEVDLGRAAVHEEEDDRLAGEHVLAVGGAGEIREGEPAERETPTRRKLASIPARFAKTQMLASPQL